MNDEEQEQALLCCLKRVNSIDKRMPLWWKKRKNTTTWKDLEGKYGGTVVPDLMISLKDLRLCDSQGEGKPYKITKRGKAVLQRGWVLKDIQWYNTGKATKFAVIISLLALLLALVQLIITAIK